MNMTHTIFAVAAAAVLGAFMVESIVCAHRADEPRAISVRADDLDLRHLPDAEVLIKRIEDASVVACGQAPDFRRPRQAESFDRCRRTAISNAIRQLNQPVLSEIAETHTWPRRLAVR
jgi:UrcA family protein